MGGKCVEIYQLRQFAAVAKTENMTRAAQSLSMEQPAVSKTIRNLESELGAELFERTGKGLRRTEQGDILLRYARAILNAELDARREIEESLHRAGGLCICALSCVERLSDILAGFAAEYGNADFRIGSTPAATCCSTAPSPGTRSRRAPRCCSTRKSASRSRTGIALRTAARSR